MPYAESSAGRRTWSVAQIACWETPQIDFIFVLKQLFSALGAPTDQVPQQSFMWPQIIIFWGWNPGSPYPIAHLNGDLSVASHFESR